MTQPGRQKAFGSERLPDIPLSRASNSYANFLPGPARRSPGAPPDHEEPAWWEADAAATLPDASRWRPGSLVANRLPPHASGTRAAPLMDGEIDHGELHQRELIDELHAMRPASPATGDPVGNIQPRAERERARRERRERRRRERDEGTAPESRPPKRRDRARLRDATTDWDDEA